MLGGISLATLDRLVGAGVLKPVRFTPKARRGRDREGRELHALARGTAEAEERADEHEAVEELARIAGDVVPRHPAIAPR